MISPSVVMAVRLITVRLTNEELATLNLTIGFGGAPLGDELGYEKWKGLWVNGSLHDDVAALVSEIAAQRLSPRRSDEETAQNP